MAKRVLAVIGAVVLVLVAIVVRGAIDDDGGGGGGGSDGGPSGDDELVLACDRELLEVCEAVDGAEVVVRSSAETSAAIVQGDTDDIDAWITTDVWLEVTAGRTERSLGTAEVLASSPAVIGVVPDRAAAVEQLCTGVPLWRCLGEHAGREWGELSGDARWGPLRSGTPPADSAIGLSLTTSVAAGYFDGVVFAANDFDAAFEGWFSRLSRASGGDDPDPLATLVSRPGTYTAAAGVSAAVRGIERPVAVLVPAPETAVTIVLVSLRGGDPVPVDAPRDRLAERGWEPRTGSAEQVLGPGVAGALYSLAQRLAG